MHSSIHKYIDWKYQNENRNRCLLLLLLLLTEYICAKNYLNENNKIDNQNKK